MFVDGKIQHSLLITKALPAEKRRIENITNRNENELLIIFAEIFRCVTVHNKWLSVIPINLYLRF